MSWCDKVSCAKQLVLKSLQQLTNGETNLRRQLVTIVSGGNMNTVNIGSTIYTVLKSLQQHPTAIGANNNEKQTKKDATCELQHFLIFAYNLDFSGLAGG